MPCEGGIADQDSRYIQAMRVIAGEVNAIDERKMEKSKKKKH